jgi:hypothetical protein
MGAITRGIANNILGSGAIDGTDALSGTVPATNIGNPSLANLTTFPPSVDAGIPQVAGDPPSPSDGDVWYNTNTYKLKVRGVSAALGSWSTGGNLNQGRTAPAFGTQTAAIAAGGSSPNPANVESYNGSVWTEVNDLTTGRNFANDTGVGTQTSGLVMGQDDPARSAKTESWNGTSWTEVNDLNDSVRGNGAFGSNNTDALSFGGENDSVNLKTKAETWNGTSWTETTDMSNGRYSGGGLGNISTAGLAVSGRNLDATPNVTTISANELWNGTSWTEVNDKNTSTFDMACAGSSTSGLAAGGYNSLSNTESWNGTSWTEVNDLSTGRSTEGGAGTSISALAVGGGSPGASTEEWNGGASNLNVDLA